MELALTLCGLGGHLHFHGVHLAGRSSPQASVLGALTGVARQLLMLSLVWKPFAQTRNSHLPSVFTPAQINPLSSVIRTVDKERFILRRITLTSYLELSLSQGISLQLPTFPFHSLTRHIL